MFFLILLLTASVKAPCGYRLLWIRDWQQRQCTMTIRGMRKRISLSHRKIRWMSSSTTHTRLLCYWHSNSGEVKENDKLEAYDESSHPTPSGKSTGGWPAYPPFWPPYLYLTAPFLGYPPFIGQSTSAAGHSHGLRLQHFGGRKVWDDDDSVTAKDSIAKTGAEPGFWWRYN